MEDINKEHEEFLNRIPDFDVFQNSLNDFLKVDLSNCNDDGIKAVYDKYIRILTFPYVLISKDEFNQNTFYRVRNLPLYSIREDISSISTYSYPLHTICKANGRANKKNTTVFYCSDYASAAMLESRQQKDQMGFLGIWKPRVNREVLISCFLSKILAKGNSMSDTAKQLNEGLLEWTISMGKHKKPQLDLLNDFLFDQFIHEKKPYALTSWISHQMMYTKLPNKAQTDGIVYPSIESSLRFCNYAFNPQFADKFLELEQVIQFTMEMNSTGKGSFSMGKIGRPINGKIEWRIPIQSEFENFHKTIHIGV